MDTLRTIDWNQAKEMLMGYEEDLLSLQIEENQE